jgi:hypothetical protein
MRIHTKTIAVTLILAAAGWFAGCNQHVDEEPNQVLEITTLTIPPITGTRDASSGSCILTITNVSAALKNLPKNHLAITSPFNDIYMQDVLINYVWDDATTTGTLAVTAAQFGIGATVPANGSITAQFPPINGQDLTSDRIGHSARLILVFRGTSVAGESVSATSGGSLIVNPCL